MIYLKLNNNKILSYNQQEELYDLESETNKFSIWLPESVDNIEINKYNLFLYIKKDNGEGDVIPFSKEENIITLKDIHIYGTKHITVWVVGELGEDSFYTKSLVFNVFKTDIINEPPKEFQITYFEKIKKEIQEFSIEDFKKEIQEHCLWIENTK